MSRAPDHKFILVVVLKGNSVDPSPNPSNQDVEIMQVAMIIVNKEQKLIDRNQFHSYVKPILRPNLDEKYKEDNHVFQYSIDAADPWPRVVAKIDGWLKERGLDVQKGNFIVATDGHNGYEKLLVSQSRISNTPVPDWALSWINIRTEFKAAHNPTDHIDRLDLDRMAQVAGVSMEGSRRGSGRDEAFDLASIVLSLLRSEHAFERVEKIVFSKQDQKSSF